MVKTTFSLMWEKDIADPLMADLIMADLVQDTGEVVVQNFEISDPKLFPTEFVKQDLYPIILFACNK